MFSIVDVNVVLSSLLGKGNSLDVFAMNSIFNKFEFVAPEFLLIELKNNIRQTNKVFRLLFVVPLSSKPIKQTEEFNWFTIEEIFKRSKLSSSDFDKLAEFLKMQIRFIPEIEFSSEIPSAKELLSENEKDIPYVALALKLNAPIFSGDKVLKRCIPDKVLSPREMLDILLRNSP